MLGEEAIISKAQNLSGERGRRCGGRVGSRKGGISGKVSAQYPGRSALCLHSFSPRRQERTKRVERLFTAVQESAEGIVIPVF